MTSDKFTCNNLLELSSMKSSEIIAGFKNSDKPILKINTVTISEMVYKAKNGDFCFASEKLTENDIHNLSETIDELKEKNVIGIAIIPDNSVLKIPQEIIDKCNKFNFCLIKLNSDVIISDIVKEGIIKILEHEINSINHIQKIAEDAIQSIIRYDNIETVLSTLENILNRDLFILCKDEIIESDNISNKKTFYKQALNENISKINYAGNFSIEFKGSHIEGYSIKLNINEDSCSNFVVIRDDIPLNETEISVLIKVVRILTLEIRNKYNIKEMKKEYQDQFLHSWLSGKIKNKNDICFSAHSYGIMLSKESKYAVIIPNDINGNQNDLNKSIEYDITKLRRMSKHITNNFYCTYYRNCVIIILEVTKDITDIESVIRQLYYKTYETLDKPISFCISADYNIEDLNDAYKEAKTTYKISNRCKIKDDIVTYQNLGIYSLLSLIPPSKIANDYIQRYVAPLKNYQEIHKLDLIETLEFYYKNNCSIKKTAEIMFTHPNTISYRLQRIKEILKKDIDAPETKLELQVTLKLLDMKNNY